MRLWFFAFLALLLPLQTATAQGNRVAPKIGEFGDWLKLKDAHVESGAVNGISFPDIAYYTVHFDVTVDSNFSSSACRSKFGIIETAEKSYRFCGYKIINLSINKDGALRVWNITKYGLNFNIEVRASPYSGRSWVEGDFLFRYVKSSQADMNCSSDGFEMTRTNPDPSKGNPSCQASRARPGFGDCECRGRERYCNGRPAGTCP